MAEFAVMRGQLKAACEQGNWDLLDKLLEIDRSLIDDDALFTDTWGSWWGMLFEAVRLGACDGVRVLLKHGARRDLPCWGDGLVQTPVELAQDQPAILALLLAPQPPDYTRTSDPPLPHSETPAVQAANRQGQIRDQTGLVFPSAAFEPPDPA